MESLNEVLLKYREQAEKEISEGPKRPRVASASANFCDLMNPVRPFFEKLSPDDKVYVRLFRLVRYAEIERFVGPAAANALWYHSGVRLGLHAVEEGLIKSLDDLPMVAVKLKIGLVDVVRNPGNKGRIHVYECMTCSGIPKWVTSFALLRLVS